MNAFYKLYCRIYQKIFWVATHLLDFSEPKIISGENSLLTLPAKIKELGLNSVLVVTDDVLYKLGMLNGLFGALDKEGVKYTCFHDTVPNPTIDNIEAALVQYKENGHQGIIAFGGGSSMDCAKGVGARVARPKKSVPQMKGLLKVGKKIPLLFAVPTTAGTGSECTLAAVICNSKTHEKYPLNDPHLIPKYAILDPVVTKDLPPHITSTTGQDALTHAVEAFIGHSNTRKTYKFAIDATKLIFANLKKAYDEPHNMEARNNMQIAAYKAGVAFTRAYVGNVHAIAHTFGGFYGVPHGLANAVILPYLLDYYGVKAEKRLAILAKAVGLKGKTNEELAKKFIQAIRDDNKYMKIPETLTPAKDADIETMITRAMSEANPLYPVPRIMGRNEMRHMYKIVGGQEKAGGYNKLV